MGSVLSSDSGKSAPASATPRALERRGDPELPVTSFDCSVCLEVLHHPVRTRCGHVFCRSCIATSLKNNKWTCPYCRAYLPSEGVPATDVAKKMKSEFQKCTECDTLVCLSEMRAHIRTCQKYIDKYGPLQELGETATRELVQNTTLGEQEVISTMESVYVHFVRRNWMKTACWIIALLITDQKGDLWFVCFFSIKSFRKVDEVEINPMKEILSTQSEP
ncbi:E3 ubiquitin-protein ligase RNF125 isoform X2 [Tursiops truncatus]|uniref:E3 ubiquitin-protein ligase RNF125 isoform X2 n=1 Tax=Tursiops truncatus TaxID=9739 RepID=UPI003CCF2E1A